MITYKEKVPLKIFEKEKRKYFFGDKIQLYLLNSRTLSLYLFDSTAVRGPHLHQIFVPAGSRCRFIEAKILLGEGKTKLREGEGGKKTLRPSILTLPVPHKHSFTGQKPAGRRRCPPWRSYCGEGARPSHELRILACPSQRARRSRGSSPSRR